MKQLFKTNQQDYRIDEFKNIILQTQKQFYRIDNNFSVITNQTNNKVFMIMKDYKKINKCDHIAVQFDFNYRIIEKFTRYHDEYILSLIYNSDKDILITGGNDQSICV